MGELLLSPMSSTGYAGVYRKGNQFKAEGKSDGRKCYLGSYATALQAAQVFARWHQQGKPWPWHDAGGEDGAAAAPAAPAPAAAAAAAEDGDDEDDELLAEAAAAEADDDDGDEDRSSFAARVCGRAVTPHASSCSVTMALTSSPTRSGGRPPAALDPTRARADWRRLRKRAPPCSFDGPHPYDGAGPLLPPLLFETDDGELPRKRPRAESRQVVCSARRRRRLRRGGGRRRADGGDEGGGGGGGARGGGATARRRERAGVGRPRCGRAERPHSGGAGSQDPKLLRAGGDDEGARCHPRGEPADGPRQRRAAARAGSAAAAEDRDP